MEMLVEEPVEQVEIGFRVSEVVPEPATLAVLLLGGLVALLRKR